MIHTSLRAVAIAVDHSQTPPASHAFAPSDWAMYLSLNDALDQIAITDGKFDALDLRRIC